MQVENVEMAIRLALGFIKVKKKHALKRAFLRKTQSSPLGFDWVSYGGY